MLNPDPKKLRWLGIDMRSRTRRRCAVVLHVAVGVLGLFTLAAATADEPVLQRYHLSLYLMLLLTLLCSQGIFREGGVVKPFQERKEHEKAPWRLRGRPGRFVMLGSLDDRAEYRYGAKFDDLAEAEQQELLMKYRVGNYLFPAEASKAPGMQKAPPILDEREQREKERANSITLKVMTGWLFYLAANYGTGHSKAMSGADIASLLLTFGFFATNGPKIYILWNEPSPLSEDDLHLVAAHADAAVE